MNSDFAQLKRILDSTVSEGLSVPQQVLETVSQFVATVYVLEHVVILLQCTGFSRQRQAS